MSNAGWKEVALGDVLTVQNGFAFSSKRFSETDGVPLIRIRDLRGSDGTTTKFNGEFDESFLVGDGDLLIGMDGEFVCYEWSGGPALLNQRVCRLRGFSTDLDPRFLLYGINKYLKQIEDRTPYTTVKHLSSKTISQIRFPIPSLAEQKRIVAKLDQAFATLDRARANTEANLADARAMFDSVLVTVFDDLLPQSAKMTLANAAKNFSRGKSRHRPRNAPELYGGSYPFIQTGDIRRSEGSIREFSQTYSEAGLAQSKLWPVGTVCITIAANIAETGVMEFEGCFPDSVIGMVPDPDVADSYYVEYMLRYFAEELKQKGKGAAQDNINLATFESARFPFPSLDDQLAVVEKLDVMADYTRQARQNYEQAITDIATLRQSLLQQAFSGQLT